LADFLEFNYSGKAWATARIPSRLLISLAKLSPLLLKLSVITRLGFDRLTYSINPSKSEWSLSATICSRSLICLQAERNSNRSRKFVAHRSHSSTRVHMVESNAREVFAEHISRFTLRRKCQTSQPHTMTFTNLRHVKHPAQASRMAL